MDSRGQAMNRLALLEETAQIISRHLEASAPLEEGVFCLLRQGKGEQGLRLLATEVLLPPPGAWEKQGRGVLRPSAQWISAAISQAINAGAGLLFVHSHPDRYFPAELSAVDWRALESLAGTIALILDGPFAAAVVHPRGWSGVSWSNGAFIPMDSVVSVGRTLRFLSEIPVNLDSELDLRQRDALGVVHDQLRQLTVAVVGCGGLGSPIAEQLLRMGVGDLLILDHDRLDTPSNVRRVFGSTIGDLRTTVPQPKVDVVGRHLDHLGLAKPVLRIDGDVRTDTAFRSLLDTDVVLIGTDTHGSRAVVNDLASTYLLPVIDVGVRVGSKTAGVLSGLIAEVRILTPTTPCLWCRGSISGDVIRAENLPEDERRQLQREGYLVGSVGEPTPSVVALTVLGAGLATCALLALLSEEGEVAPSGYWVDGFFGDARETEPVQPVAGCRCRRLLGQGDRKPPPLVRNQFDLISK